MTKRVLLFLVFALALALIATRAQQVEAQSCPAGSACGTVVVQPLDTTTTGDYRTAGYGRCFFLIPNPVPCTPPDVSVGSPSFFQDNCVEQPIGPRDFNGNPSDYINTFGSVSNFSVCAGGDFTPGLNQPSSTVNWSLFTGFSGPP